MILKNTIITILIILLLITIYFYYNLSSNMMDYQKERLQYIEKKEKEIKEIENKLGSLNECAKDLENCTNTIDKINDKYSNMHIGVNTTLTNTQNDINNMIIDLKSSTKTETEQIINKIDDLKIEKTQPDSSKTESNQETKVVNTSNISNTSNFLVNQKDYCEIDEELIKEYLRIKNLSKQNNKKNM